MRPLFGAIAGAIATGPMTAVIVAGRKARMLWTPPPKQITANVASRAGVKPDLEDEEFQAAWLAAHFGYGAACGAVYSIIRPMLPGSVTIKGLVFGELVWGVSYLGYIPALRLYPWPKDDSRTRMAVMIAAHAVFGIMTAQIEHTLVELDNPGDGFVTLEPPKGLGFLRG
jgi:hypothetical protein